MTLGDMAVLFNLECSSDVVLSGVSIDSRHVQPGQLFVAIRGERFDGHDFVHEAISNGAAALLCSQTIPDVTIPQLVVKDTLDAMAVIAKKHRQQCSCAVIALTGSNGKTTVKDMIATILPKPSHATTGNLNNHIGVPLSVLRLKKEDRYAVFELGANHLGEIAHTVAIVQPEVTLINNIAPAHIAEFGSIDAVVRAKGEIHQGLSPNGTAVINHDDSYAHAWDALLNDKKTVYFSRVDPTVAIHARALQFDTNGCGRFVLVTPMGEAQIELHVPGAHNVSNALAAAACTYALGIDLSDIQSGLCEFHGVAGRMTFRQGKHDSLIIDDTYNANLRSSLIALEVLAKRPGRRIFVFGDMGELGAWSEQHHQEVGAFARQQGIDLLMTCGVQSEFTTKAYGGLGKHYTHQAELVRDLLPFLDANTTVLVKGSRSSAMETIVKQVIA